MAFSFVLNKKEYLKIILIHLQLNSKGIITDEELDSYVTKYREELNQLDSRVCKLNNIENEVETVKRNYKHFINYLDGIDLDNLKNSDLKKIFSKVIIKTIEIDSSMSIDEISKNFKRNRDLFFIDKNKKTIKVVSAEHMFMNIEESELYKEV